MHPKSMEPDRTSFSINSLSLSIRLISTIYFICFQRSFSRLDQTIKLNGSRCSKHSASLKKIRKIRVIRVRPSLSVILSTCILTLNSTLYRRTSASDNGSNLPSFISRITLPDSNERRVCHCPAGMFSATVWPLGVSSIASVHVRSYHSFNQLYCYTLSATIYLIIL